MADNSIPVSSETNAAPRHVSAMRVVMRGLEVALLAAGVVLAIGFGVVCIRGTAQERHQRELDRIADWVGRARISLPAGEPVLGWQNLLTAIHNSLYNPLGSVRYTPTDKVRALADALDASGAQDLATVDGVFRIMDRICEINPVAADYGPFEQARMEYGRPGPMEKKP